MTAAFGAFSIPVLFLVMHGPVATNILNLYSASLAALSLDVKVARWKVSIVVSIVGTGVLIVFIQSDELGDDFDKWLASVVVWISAVGRRDARRLLRLPARQDRRPGAVRRPEDVDLRRRQLGGRDRARSPGVVAGWAWEYGLVGFLQGPIAKATHNTDLSWLTGFVVAGILYYVLRPFFAKREEPEPATIGT